MKQNESKHSNESKFMEWAPKILVGSLVKAATVPPTQILMVWMKQSQANLHLGMIDVLKLTFERGIMAGWEIGALREFVKSGPKFCGITVANSAIANELPISDDTNINKAASAFAKGSITAGFEGPFATFFNRWITFNITAGKNNNYFSYLKEKGNNTVSGMTKEALKGNVLTSCRQVFSNSLIIGTTSALTAPVSEKFKEYNEKVQKLIIGICVGVTTAVVVAPTETILTQIQKAGKSEHNASSALRNVFINHGLTALYRGVTQKMGLITVGSAITSIFQQYASQLTSSEKTGHERE